jgi:hypothetical protein
VGFLDKAILVVLLGGAQSLTWHQVVVALAARVERKPKLLLETAVLELYLA